MRDEGFMASPCFAGAVRRIDRATRKAGYDGVLVTIESGKFPHVTFWDKTGEHRAELRGGEWVEVPNG